MTFLPIVERELRAAARRGINRSRLAMASLAVFAGGMVLLVCQVVAPWVVSQQQWGGLLFQSLAGLLLAYCLLVGRFSTVDSLGRERREGTLGLLFLTDLKGYDIIFGKLAATSVQAFYGLLAALPVLAVPLLMGGVSYGEFWRMIVLLVDTFLLSLAIGMFASAFGRDLRQAAGLNFLVILVLMALPAAGQAIWNATHASAVMIHELFFSSPFHTFFLAFDRAYRLPGGYFWQSIAALHLLTWGLILLANWRLPRSWRDEAPAPVPAGRGRRGLGRNYRYGSAAARAAFRKTCLDQNAYYWLAARARGKPLQVWIFLAFAIVWWTVGRMSAGSNWLDPGIYFTTAVLLNLAFKLWVTGEAAQRMAEDKQAGAFELLLTTPLTVRDILGGQLRALRRQFFGPLLLALAAELLLRFAPGRLTGSSLLDHSIYLGAEMVMLPVDMIALVGVAMVQGLRSGSASRAAMSAVLRIMVLPYLGMGLVVLARDLSIIPPPPPAWQADGKFYWSLWVALGVVTDLYFGGLAWRRLLTGFASLAAEQGGRLQKVAQPPAPATRTAGAASDPKLNRRRRSRVRRAIAAACLLVVIAVALRAGRRNPHPPPVVVRLGPGNAPMRISASAMGAVFILSDGTLWCWGQTGAGDPLSRVPQTFTPQPEWVDGMISWYTMLVIKRDGTLWQLWNPWVASIALRDYFPGGGKSWHPAYAPAEGRLGENLRLVNGKNLPDYSSHSWVRVSAGSMHYLGLRDDGSLWAWGVNSQQELGHGTNLTEVFPVMVGTNRDWSDVRAMPGMPGCTLALRKDGTLWAWGGVSGLNLLWHHQPGTWSLPAPAQVCRETNWTGFPGGNSGLVVNQAGEVWAPFSGPLGANISASTNCQLLFTHYIPGRFAVATTGEKACLYQIRDDGTLWQTANPDGNGSLGSVPVANWRRVGKRSDWRELWSTDFTTFGLTSDGVIWTWGFDLGREPVETWWSRGAALAGRIVSFFFPSAAGGGAAFIRPSDSEPWPLMKLVPTGAAGREP